MGVMSNLLQTGEIFIKFNEYGMPEYFFDCDTKNHTITKLRQLTSFELTSVELPTWDVPSQPLNPAVRNENMLPVWQNYQDRLANQPQVYGYSNTGLESTLATYAEGGVKVANKCFYGYHDLQVVAPNDYAVRFEPGCFDENANIELVVPAQMALKQVNHVHNTGFTYDRDRWTLLAHQDFNFHGTGPRDSYGVKDCDPNTLPYHLTVKHQKPHKKLSTCLIEGHQAVHQKIADDAAKLANHWVHLHGDLHELHNNLHQHLQQHLRDLHDNLHADLAKKLHRDLPPLQK